jgi:hypothetical protein
MEDRTQEVVDLLEQAQRKFPTGKRVWLKETGECCRIAYAYPARPDKYGWFKGTSVRVVMPGKNCNFRTVKAEEVLTSSPLPDGAYVFVPEDCSGIWVLRLKDGLFYRALVKVGSVSHQEILEPLPSGSLFQYNSNGQWIMIPECLRVR